MRIKKEPFNGETGKPCVFLSRRAFEGSFPWRAESIPRYNKWAALSKNFFLLKKRPGRAIIKGIQNPKGASP